MNMQVGSCEKLHCIIYIGVLHSIAQKINQNMYKNAIEKCIKKVYNICDIKLRRMCVAKITKGENEK